jgi:hypothetical protein
VGTGAGLDRVAKKRISCPCQESNLSHQACSLVIILTELPQLSILINHRYKSIVVTRDTQHFFCISLNIHHIEEYFKLKVLMFYATAIFEKFQLQLGFYLYLWF